MNFQRLADSTLLHECVILYTRRATYFIAPCAQLESNVTPHIKERCAAVAFGVSASASRLAPDLKLVQRTVPASSGELRVFESRQVTSCLYISLFCARPTVPCNDFFMGVPGLLGVLECDVGTTLKLEIIGYSPVTLWGSGSHYPRVGGCRESASPLFEKRLKLTSVFRWTTTRCQMVTPIVSGGPVPKT